MKVTYHTAIDIVVEGKDEKEIEEKFFELNLGNLDEEKKKGNIVDWDFVDDCSSVEESEIER